MSYFSLNKIGFSYEGKVVLEDIHFSVEKGDYLCIVAENGAGKSTLLKGILGLKKPNEGEIILGDGLKRQDIGYLPQQTGARRDSRTPAHPSRATRILSAPPPSIATR